MLHSLSSASHSVRCLTEEMHSVESRIHQVSDGEGKCGLRKEGGGGVKGKGGGRGSAGGRGH